MGEKGGLDHDPFDRFRALATLVLLLSIFVFLVVKGYQLYF